MSYRTKIKTKGGGGKQGGRKRNNFRNNNQPNNNSDSNTSNIEELETATYIVSQLFLYNLYEIITKYIIRYVIRKLPGGVHLAHGMCNDKLPKMSLDPNPKQPRGTRD